MWAHWADFISFGLGKPAAAAPKLPEPLQQIVCLVRHVAAWDKRPAECRTGIFATINPFQLPKLG